jgi:thiol-disulfide isomerase/thioredoxin
VAERRRNIHYRCFCDDQGHEKRPVITLFTKLHTPCPLCDEAKEQLEKFSSVASIEECYIDVEDNKNWRRLYEYDIPVVHLDGRFLMKHKIDLDKLRKELQL